MDEKVSSLYNIVQPLLDRGIVLRRSLTVNSSILELYTYGKGLSSWSQFSRYRLYPALFRSTVFQLTCSTRKLTGFYPALTKVPNFGELSREERSSVTPLRAYRKVDGSLVGVSRAETIGLIVRSKGSWDNFVVNYFNKFIQQEGLHDQLLSIMERLPPHSTLHFELVCSLPQRVWRDEVLGKLVKRTTVAPVHEGMVEVPHSAVGREIETICALSAKYGTLRAYLLFAKIYLGNASFDYRFPEEFEWPYKPFKVSGDIDKLQDFVNETEDEEGLMVWVDGWRKEVFNGFTIDPVLKMKNAHYLMINTTAKSAKSIYLLTRMGRADDLLVIYPENIVRLAQRLARLEDKTRSILSQYLVCKECPVVPKGVLAHIRQGSLSPDEAARELILSCFPRKGSSEEKLRKAKDCMEKIVRRLEKYLSPSEETR